MNNIVLLGTGNLAWHLSQTIISAGFNVIQVYGRSQEKAAELASALNTEYTDDIHKLKPADVYIFAISDTAIPEVLSARKWNNSLLLHTAGSVSINVFKSYSESYGILYPLQSFTKGSYINFSEVPFLVEANNDNSLLKIKEIASKISNSVHVVDSEMRSQIHLAAVFASNYVNYMLGIAGGLLKEKQIDLSILKPLIGETIKKSFELGAIDAQTGPARRQNLDILKKHEQMLATHPDWQKMYTFVAENILKFYQQYDGKF